MAGRGLGLGGAVGFLTVLGRPSAPTPAALPWFPVVGAGLGAVLGGLWWVAEGIWPPLVAAGVVVAADLALTGLLHADGLADTGDGLLPPLARERRLAVMAAPDTGAFGASVLVVTLLLRVAALAAIAPSGLLLAGLWCASRSLLAVVATTVPYARPTGGLASPFLGGPRRRRLPVVGLLVAAGLAGAWSPAAGLLAAVVGLAAGAGVVGLARRRLGGFTGDVLGATAMIVETVGLVVAAARW
jgi:adenosylcobinamide-GDP ribazoletransferase